MQKKSGTQVSIVVENDRHRLLVPVTRRNIRVAVVVQIRCGDRVRTVGDYEELGAQLEVRILAVPEHVHTAADSHGKGKVVIAVTVEIHG